MTQPSSPEFYEDFLDLSWIDRKFHLDLFCLSSTIHLSWTQILTPVSWVLLIEKANLSQKHQVGNLGQSITPSWDWVPPVWSDKSVPLWKHGTTFEECRGSLITSLRDPKFFSLDSSPIPQHEEDGFLEFSKKAEEDPFRAVASLRTFPELPTVFCVIVGNAE